MSKIFYVSDTHFSHKNILKYVNRPFKTIEEMDKMLIKNWNKIVGEDDIVFHLGDFGLAKYERLLNIFKQLNGYKVLIPGNHDNNKVLRLPWDDIKPLIYVIKDSFKNQIFNICLCHYPLIEWPAKYNNSIHLHGHIHDANIPNDVSFRRINISIDKTNFKPITLEDILTDQQFEISEKYFKK